MNYVDGFVLAVPRKNLKKYAKMAKLGARMWMKHGAVDYKECIADDMRVMPGCGVPFPKLARAKKGEVVFFSYIVFKSRAHRDSVNKKVMKAFEKMGMPPEMPFDMKRMAYGGFKELVGG